MKRQIMNVTPAEFVDIQLLWNDPFVAEIDAVSHMSRYYGCEQGTHYSVVVHRRAPTIPMLSWNLPRFDDGETSCTAEDCHE